MVLAIIIIIRMQRCPLLTWACQPILLAQDLFTEEKNASQPTIDQLDIVLHGVVLIFIVPIGWSWWAGLRIACGYCTDEIKDLKALVGSCGARGLARPMTLRGGVLDSTGWTTSHKDRQNLIMAKVVQLVNPDPPAKLQSK